MLNRITILSLLFALCGSSHVAFSQAPGRPSVEDLLSGGNDSEGAESQSSYVFGQPIEVSGAQIRCIDKPLISAQADGLIRELRVDDGSYVQSDELLFAIDDRIAQAEMAVAKKQLESAIILAKQTANVEFSRKAQELAKEEFQSSLELYRKYAATESEVKRKKLEMEKSGFSIDMAMDETKKYELDAAVAQEQVNASKVRLDLYRVLAPFPGIVVERKRSAGEWIRAGEPVCQLLRMDEMKVEAYVPLDGISAPDLRNAEMRISVRISARQQPMQIPASVSFVSPKIDSRRVLVSARIPNQQDANGNWLLSDGMPATVSITPR